MDLRDIWATLNVDQAYSWLHVFSIYFFHVFPFFVFVPQRFYSTTVTAVGLVSACHIGWHFSRFLANTKNVSHRKERLRLNIAELRESLKDADAKSIKNANMTGLSFDELSAILKDNALDKETLLKAFRLKALERKRFNAVTDYIMGSTSVPAVSADGEDSSTNDNLNGIPVSITEAFEINGKDRTLGLGEFVGISGTTDAHIVKALKAAGAIPFLRTNVAQGYPLSIGLGSSNPIFGRTFNPLDTSRSAGGGSCGEACALALNISVLGVAADVAGGARIPAHFCGVAALRPTAHRLSAHGLIQAQSEVSACVSPMSRCVSGLVAFTRATCGRNHNEIDPSAPQKDFDDQLFEADTQLRIGYYTDDSCTRTTPSVHRAVNEAKKILEKNGHKMVQFEPPDMKHMLTNLLYPATMGCNRVLWNLLSQDLVDASSRDFYYRARRANPLRWIIAWCRHDRNDIEGALEAAALPVTLSDWWLLRNKIQEFRQEYHALWRRARLDAVVGPVFPCAAVNLANERRFLGLYSLLNYPAGTVPVTRVKGADLSQFHTAKFRAVSPLEELMMQDQLGDEASKEKSAIGLPVGVQVAALPFHEEVVLRVMKELEEGRQEPSFSEQGRRSSPLNLRSSKTNSNFSESEIPSDSLSLKRQSNMDNAEKTSSLKKLSEDEDNQPNSRTSQPLGAAEDGASGQGSSDNTLTRKSKEPGSNKGGSIDSAKLKQSKTSQPQVPPDSKENISGSRKGKSDAKKQKLARGMSKESIERGITSPTPSKQSKLNITRSSGGEDVSIDVEFENF